jgi:mannose-6-phosphate isomerase-like protein (cupin superfamily)
MSVPQAPLDDGSPAGPGWFVVNLDGAPAGTHERAGIWTELDTREAPFEDYGINVHVVQPGQPNAMYHAENRQEDFLVLYGECIAIIEDTEQHLRTWDFVHCPRGTRHVFVGAGDGPCAILMVGARPSDAEYPPSDLAAKYGASAADPANPYAGWEGGSGTGRFSWPPAR